MSDEDSIFPLVDRRTPLADRVNRIRNGGGGENAGRSFGKMLTAETEEEKTGALTTFTNEFREGMAKELGVDVDSISTEIPSELQSMMIELQPDDVLTREALVEHGLEEEKEEAEEEDEDDGEDEDEEEGSKEEPESSVF